MLSKYFYRRIGLILSTGLFLLIFFITKEIFDQQVCYLSQPLTDLSPVKLSCKLKATLAGRDSNFILDSLGLNTWVLTPNSAWSDIEAQNLNFASLSPNLKITQNFSLPKPKAEKLIFLSKNLNDESVALNNEKSVVALNEKGQELEIFRGKNVSNLSFDGLRYIYYLQNTANYYDPSSSVWRYDTLNNQAALVSPTPKGKTISGFVPTNNLLIYAIEEKLLIKDPNGEISGLANNQVRIFDESYAPINLRSLANNEQALFSNPIFFDSNQKIMAIENSRSQAYIFNLKDKDSVIKSPVIEGGISGINVSENIPILWNDNIIWFLRNNRWENTRVIDNIYAGFCGGQVYTLNLNSINVLGQKINLPPELVPKQLKLNHDCQGVFLGINKKNQKEELYELKGEQLALIYSSDQEINLIF